MDRIIHVPRRFTDYEWGGTETVVLELSRSQKAAGLSPEIVTSKALDHRDEQIYQGIPVRRFSHLYPCTGLSTEDRHQLDRKGGNLVSFPLMHYLWKQENIRILHAHSLKRLGGVVRTVSKIRNIPYVVTLHGGFFDVPEEESENIRRPLRGWNKFEWGKIPGAILGSHRVMQDADWVLCVGENEFKKAKDMLGHDRISYLPNGVDERKFRSGYSSAFREKFGIPTDAYVISCISRIDYQKNQKILVEAFTELLKLDSNTILVLAGSVTHPVYAGEIRKWIEKWDLAGKIRWLPGLSNDSEDLINAFQAADVMVLPSIHEPFGIVVLEAWSAGKPVIVSNTGGLKSLVTHGENGLKFEPRSADAKGQLLRHILRLQGDRDLGTKLGMNGREAVRRHYSWSQIRAKLDKIYDHAVERRVRVSGSAGRPFFPVTQG